MKHSERDTQRATDEPHSLVRAYVVWVVAALIVAYTVAFFATPLRSLSDVIGHPMTRFDVLLFLAEPVLLVSTWFGEPGQAGFLDRAPILLLAIGLLLYAVIMGWWIMSLLGADQDLDPGEVLVLAAGIGLNLVSLCTLLVGLLGWLHVLVFVVPAAITLAAAGQRWQKTSGLFDERQTKIQKKTQGEVTTWLSRRWLWLAVPAGAAIVLGGMLPPGDFDVREYHLQGPKEYFQSGRIIFLPHNVYAQMPLGAEMYSLTGMVLIDDWWRGALIGKTVIALLAPLSALAVFLIGRRLFSVEVGIIAAVLYLTLPWTARVSMTGLIDGVVGFYTLLALFAVIIAIEALVRQDDQESTASRDLASRTARSRFIVVGFLAGAAVACKYPALLFAVVPLAVWVALASWQRRSSATLPYWQPLAILVLAAVIGCGLWFAKNIVQTGNPTYPLLYDWFGGKTRTAELNQRWERAHQPRPQAGGGSANAFSVREMLHSASGVLLRSDYLGPVIMPLAVLGLVAAGKHRRLVFCFAVYLAFVFLSWWLLTHRIDRFWVPVLPVVALLAGVGATFSSARAWRYFVILLLVASAVYGFLCNSSGTIVGADRRFFVALDQLRIDPQRVNTFHLDLNRAKGVGTLLLVGDAQPFDLEVEQVQYNTTFDESILVEIMRGRDANEVHQELLRRGITHIFVHWSEIDRYRSPGNYGFAAEVKPDVFIKLMTAGALTAIADPDQKGRFWLFSVNPPLLDEPATP